MTSRRLCALLLGLAATGCRSGGPRAEWQEQALPATSERVLLEVSLLAMQKTGFPIGAGVDPGRRRVESGWNTSLAPFRGQGFREKCEVTYEPASSGAWTVRVRVRREVNMDIVRPLDLSYAQWEPRADNVERARAVLQYARSMLGSPLKPAAAGSG